MKLTWIFICMCFCYASSFAQMIVAEGFSANVLVNNVLVGDGVQTRNVVFSGYDRSFALFENGLKADLGLDKGIILSSGVAVGVKGPNNTESYTSGLGGPGNSILEKLAGTNTLDAAVLQFDFKPQTNRIEFKYIFASEEYKEWVDKGFSDIFGFFISGPGIIGEKNVALLPVSGKEVSIDNVNHKRNSQYYVDNTDITTNTNKYLQPDGLTTVLIADLDLIPCQWYTIKLAISDVGDQAKDSWVFIESKSFKHKTGFGKDTVLCLDDFIQTLDAGNPGRKVLWSTGETTQKIEVTKFGSYSVEVFTECGSFKDEINLLPSIAPIFIGNDTNACELKIDVNLEVKNRKFESYQWSTGDTTPSLRVTLPGTYWLTVQRDGCFRSDTINISNLDLPKFSLGKDTLVCGKLNFTLSTDIESDSFFWSTGATSKSIDIKQAGTYWLKATNGGCSFEDTVNIANRDVFAIDLGPPNIELCETREVTLDTKIRDLDSYEILWNTGDTAAFIKTQVGGFYQVVVRDPICNYEASDEITIEMLAAAQDFFVPNAFSPNGDGLNDSVKPVFSFNDIERYQFVIFNKWGQKIFESSTPGEAWDGTVESNMSAPDVYIWYCSIKTACLPDPLQNQNGTLTLLR